MILSIGRELIAVINLCTVLGEVNSGEILKNDLRSGLVEAETRIKRNFKREDSAVNKEGRYGNTFNLIVTFLTCFINGNPRSYDSSGEIQKWKDKK